MNQSFKKKVIAASVAATFVAVGAGFVAVPGISPISAAQANQFSDTTQSVATSGGVNVPAAASALATGQIVVITESVAGAIAPAGTGVTGGSILIGLDNGAKFKAGTVVQVLGSGQLNGKSGSLVDVNALYTVTGPDLDDSGRIALFLKAASTGTAMSIRLTNITLDTSASTVGSPINVSIASASTATGITKGTNTLMANVVSKGATIALASTTANNIAAGQTLTMKEVDISEAVPSSFVTSTNTSTADVTITLPSGYTWASKPTMATLSGTDVATGGTVNGTGTGSTTAIAAYKFNASAVPTTAVGAVKFTGGTVFVPTGTAPGNIDATVTVYSGNASMSTSTVTLGSIVAAGTSSTFVEASGSTATVDYNTLFAGRTYSALSSGIGGEVDQLKVAELVGAALATNGTITLTVTNGAYDTSGTPLTKADTTIVLGAASYSTDKKTATMTVTTPSTTTAGSSLFTIGNLDMTNATAGDFSVTVGGTAGVSAQTVKMADVVNATSASVAAGAPTVTAGSVYTIPEISITEGKYSAIAAANVVGIELPAGTVIQKATGDANDGDALTNGTDVTVKVYNAAGTDVTSTALGASPTLTVGNGVSGTARQLFITMTSASTSTTGAYTIKVTGLKAKASSSATAGDINATIGGASAAGTSTVAAMGAEDAATWTSKASATKTTVKVAGIVAATVPDIVGTATGTSSSLTLTSNVVAAGNDQGKIGTIFVVAVLPNGQVYSRDAAGAWTLWDGVTPFKAVQTGVTLGTHSGISIVSATNVSTIVGTQVYVGYGIGALGNSAYTNLLANATYKKVYTVQ